MHACCGPCSTYSTERLLDEGYRPTLFFANPNIHPYREYASRLASLRVLAGIRSLPVLVEPAYEPEEYFRLITGHEEERCRLCYELRLRKTARHARELGFDRFGTTLLISPYQQHDLLLETGRAAAAEFGLVFHEADWRSGFRASQAKAKEYGLYRQQYCGCLYSERDRFLKRN